MGRNSYAELLKKWEAETLEKIKTHICGRGCDFGWNDEEGNWHCSLTRQAFAAHTDKPMPKKSIFEVR